MDRLARELATEKKAAWAVVAAGSVRLGAHWVTEIGAAGRLSQHPKDALVRTDTWFDLASVTKPLTAMAAARLVRAGALRLDAPLESLLPEVEGSVTGTLSLELLLAHRAGLHPHRRLYRGLANGRLTNRRDALIEAASARRSQTPTAMPETGFDPL